MVERHKEHVDDNAQRDEKLSERVKDNEREELADSNPQPTAVPDAADLNALHDVLGEDVFALGTFVVIVVHVSAQGRRFA